ncbi:MAG: ATP phosphoribosyltransferase regulatory subunit [Nitrospira sp.]
MNRTFVQIAAAASKPIPFGFLTARIPECRAITETAPRLADSLSDESRSYFVQVLAGLEAIKIPYSLNHRLVRGLDYYNLTTFEVTATNLGAQNAVGAGGRYDGLVETLGGPPTPAVGFALGLERMSLLLPETEVAKIPKEVTVYVAGFGTHGAVVGLTALEELRLTGLSAVSDFRSTTLKAHLRQADRLGCRFTLIIGDDEVGKGTAVLRDMETKVQCDVHLSNLRLQIPPYLANS